MRVAPVLASLFCHFLAGGAGADESCLIIDSHCVDLREYLVSQPASSTVDTLRERVGDILVDNYYPAYPQSDQITCVPNARLPALLEGKEFDMIRTEFKFPRSIVPPLVEFVLRDGSRYCYLDQGNS